MIIYREEIRVAQEVVEYQMKWYKGIIENTKKAGA